ncbi:MAG: ferrous iron transport protein A [Chloroflexota bacterium]
MVPAINKNKNKRARLSEAPADQELKIVMIRTGLDEKQKLSSMGLHIDDLLFIVRRARFGPILLRMNSDKYGKIAVSRPIADNILVEY